MADLIPIYQHDEQQVVSARELYEFLGVQSNFTTWCQRMFEYGFSESIDYISISSKKGKNEKSVGRTATDYGLTLETAKEIAMIQRTPKGKEARNYFIAVEKRFKHLVKKANSLPDFTNPAEAARAFADQYERAQMAEQAVKYLAPKADYTDNVLASTSEWTTTTIAKELGLSATALNRILTEKGVLYKNSDGVWVLKAAYQDKGYTKTRTHYRRAFDGEIVTSIYTVWTELGRYFIHQKVNSALRSPVSK